MLLNRYVLFLALATMLSTVAFEVVLHKLDPVLEPRLAVSFFLICLFFMTSGILSFFGYLIRIVLYQDQLFLNHFNVSLRQGIILGFVVCLLMGLQIIRTLSVFNGFVIVLFGFLIEMYSVARE